jgi:hypothetical protein
MALAGDSILVTPGSGATVATETVNSKEHQVMMMADHTGHLIGSKDVYFFRVANQVHVAAATTVHWDLWNGDASKIVRVISIAQLPDIVTAVTGVATAWDLIRTTSLGTGGSAQTAWLPDLSQTAMDADVTCRSKPTGGAAASTILKQYTIHSEETNAATQMYATLAAGGFTNLVPVELCPPNSWVGITLRPSQGLALRQQTNSSAGNSGWLIGFTIE